MDKVTDFLSYTYDKFEWKQQRVFWIGVVEKLCYMALIGYTIGYVLIYDKGYQAFDSVQSITTTKLKGPLYTNFSELNGHSLNQRIFDDADYVEPPQGNNAFFVTTNWKETVNQRQDECTEDSKMQNVNCSTDADCPRGQHVMNGNGVRTGQCNQTASVCMVYAWCPIEEDIPFLRNILEHDDPDYLRKCRYNQSDPVDSLCPIFELGTMVQQAGEDYDDLAIKGGVIKISIEWNCNLDKGFDNCLPRYSFRRLDLPNASIAPGYNFRYANYYQDANGVMRRDLIKATGIRFLIEVSGQAGKADAERTIHNLGSIFGLAGIVKIVATLLLLAGTGCKPYKAETIEFGAGKCHRCTSCKGATRPDEGSCQTVETSKDVGDHGDGSVSMKKK